MMKRADKILVIGGSAGSLTMVLQLIPHLKADMHIALLIIFHRKEDDESALLEILSHKTKFLVKEVEDKEVIQTGVVYIAPANYHVLIEKSKNFSLDYSERINYSRPSIDVTFESASDVYGKSMAGLLLSGANADGVEGLKVIKQNGGLVIVQDPRTAEVPYMPRYAVENVTIDLILTPHNIEICIERILMLP